MQTVELWMDAVWVGGRILWLHCRGEGKRRLLSHFMDRWVDESTKQNKQTGRDQTRQVHKKNKKQLLPVFLNTLMAIGTTHGRWKKTTSPPIESLLFRGHVDPTQ